MMRFIIAFCMLHVAQALNAFQHLAQIDEQFWSNRSVHLAAIKAKLTLNFPQADEDAIQTVAESLQYEPAFRDLDSAACHEQMLRLADGILGSAEVPTASAQSAVPDMKEQVNAYLASNDYTSAPEYLIDIVVDDLKSKNLSGTEAIHRQLDLLAADQWFGEPQPVVQQVASIAFPDVAAQRRRDLNDELHLPMILGTPAHHEISRLLGGFEAQYGVGHTRVQIDEAAADIRFKFAEALKKGIAVSKDNVCLVFSLVTSVIEKFAEQISEEELRRLVNWSRDIKMAVYEDLKSDPSISMKNWLDFMPSDKKVVDRILKEIKDTAVVRRFSLVHDPSKHRMNILFVDHRIEHAKVGVVSLNPHVPDKAHNIWIRNETGNHFYPLRPVSAQEQLRRFREAEAAKTQAASRANTMMMFNLAFEEFENSRFSKDLKTAQVLPMFREHFGRTWLRIKTFTEAWGKASQSPPEPDHLQHIVRAYRNYVQSKLNPPQVRTWPSLQYYGNSNRPQSVLVC